MKRICFLAIAALFSVTIFAQTNDPNVASQSDPDEIAAIVLAQNGHSPAYGMSFIEKQLHSMGDAVAVGVIQYLGERKTTVSEDVVSPDEMKMILLIVRKSFEEPALIKPEKNRSPRATLVLLKYLGALPPANAVRDDLERTTRFAEHLRLSASAPTTP